MNMLRGTRVAIGLILCASFGACANGDKTEAEIASRIEALGYDSSTAEFNHGWVVVEGDVVFDREKLLAGEYDAPAPTSDVEKGYRYASIVSSTNVGNIKLAFTGTSDTVKAGVRSAAQDWSGVGQSALRISETNTGPTITVRIVNYANWNTTSGLTPCPSVGSCSEAPSNGKPGANIWMPSRMSAFSSCLNWTPSALARMARHELGHAVGFAHPKESGSTLITQGTMSTKACTSTAATCLKTPGYDTVMSHWTMTTTCTTNIDVLTFDDRVSCSVVY